MTRAQDTQLAEAKAEIKVATHYAERLATALWEKYWRNEAPRWRPLNDLVGLLTQIDNMTAGLSREPRPQEKK